MSKHYEYILSTELNKILTTVKTTHNGQLLSEKRLGHTIDHGLALDAIKIHYAVEKMKNHLYGEISSTYISDERTTK